jgi:hypothetical protein
VGREGEGKRREKGGEKDVGGVGKRTREGGEGKREREREMKKWLEQFTPKC